jgi:hypothetical protein
VFIVQRHDGFVEPGGMTIQVEAILAAFRKADFRELADFDERFLMRTSLLPTVPAHLDPRPETILLMYIRNDVRV